MLGKNYFVCPAFEYFEQSRNICDSLVPSKCVSRSVLGGLDWLRHLLELV